MRETHTLALRLCLGGALSILALPAANADDAGGAVFVPASLELHAPAPAALLPDPLTSPEQPLDPESLLLLAQQRVSALGPLSIGTPDAGLLVNPLRMPEGPYWKVRNPYEAYGTGETIDFIVRAIERVEARFPGSPRLVVGDVSLRGGGRLNRHRSHQAGRDVDLGFYYAAGEARDFFDAHGRDLDLPRTWTLVRALITDTDVERIFVDRSIMSVLYAYARDVENEDVDWLNDVFGRQGVHYKGVIQHERGHRNHLHVRFFNQLAQEHGRVVYPVLLEGGLVPPPRIRHRVSPGETIGGLAARYGTSVAAIRAANGLRSSRLRAGRSYTIPVRRAPQDGGPIVVPPRRLPPVTATLAQGGASLPASEMAE